MTISENHIITMKSDAIIRGEFTCEDLEQLISIEDHCGRMELFKDTIKVYFSCIADAEFFADKFFGMTIQTYEELYHIEIN